MSARNKILIGLVSIGIFNPTLLQAAVQQKNPPDSLGNPFMLLMLVMIFVLVLFIVVLNFSIKSIVTLKKFQEPNQSKSSSVISKGITSVALVLICTTGFTQVNTNTTLTEIVNDENSWTLFGMTYMTFYGLLAVIVFELIVISFQILLLKGLINYAIPKKEVPIQNLVPKENLFWKKINASVAIEDEQSILFEHEYDGIRELDNNLPPWWKYGFYFTILFAFAYMIHFHIAKSGALQEQEYLTEIEEGKKQVAEYLRTAADNVDENTVKYLDGASDLKEGKEIFSANCVACHGTLGEGKVGPNLTDQYWLHDGKINDIFFSIKYGWADKGMKSWKDDLTPKQIAKVASFIKSLKGTNPPNAQEPKGELFKE